MGVAYPGPVMHRYNAHGPIVSMGYEGTTPIFQLLTQGKKWNFLLWDTRLIGGGNAYADPIEDRARFLMQDSCMKHHLSNVMFLMQDWCMKGADHTTYPSAEMWCPDAG